MIRFLPTCLFLAFFLLFLQKTTAQTPNPCGTPAEKSEWLRYYQAHLADFPQRNDDTTWLYVPMTLHVVGTDVGTGYFSTEKCFTALCELNQDYFESRIHFYLARGLNFIDNSAWFNHAEFGPGGQMMQQNNFADCLNSYIVSNPAGNCGYYWGQFDGIALNKSCVESGDNTWAHELGHNLSLPHPFFGWEGHNNYNYTKPAPTDWDGYPVEKTDGSNCQFASDGFCDTPPDYLNYRWDCNSEDLSFVTQNDPDTIPFVSDGTLYMSYSLDKCSSRFSHEQIKAMRTNLQTQRADILSITQPTPDLASNATAEPISPINAEIVQFDSVHLVWQAVPGAEFYNISVALYNIPGAKFFVKMVDASQTSVDVKVILPINKDFRWSVIPYSTWDFCKPDSTILGKFHTANLLAINELERIADVQLVPNPASIGSGSRLEIASSEAFSGRLEILDFSGKNIFTQNNIQLFEGENTVELPISNLPQGVFFVHLSSEKGRISRRLAIF
jgi:hypothetical protein